MDRKLVTVAMGQSLQRIIFAEESVKTLAAYEAYQKQLNLMLLLARKANQ